MQNSKLKLALVFVFVLHVVTLQFAVSQTKQYVYRDKADTTTNCYLAVIPDIKPIKGIVVRDYSTLPDTSKPSRFKFATLVSASGFLMLYTVTSKQNPSMYYTDEGPALLDDIIHEVVIKYKVKGDKLFLGGISSSGTRALRFAQYCVSGKSEYKTTISGVFAVDSPLDIERFYLSARQNRVRFKKGMLEEADLVLNAFPRYLGPFNENQTRYRASSVFAQNESDGGNAQLLKDINLYLVHEPDIDWWMSERGAAYFDINSYDMAALVLKLRSLGNDKVKFVTTSVKGYDAQGNRNCHSWTIVDEEDLMAWILSDNK